jgi:hypothetical protein
MKLDIFQKIGISLGVILLLFILASTLLKDEVKTESTIIVQGQLQTIERFKLRNKWSISFNIKIKGDSNYYKILPEYYDCFDNVLFFKNVTEGQLIKIKIDTDNGLRSNSYKSIIAIESNGKEYIDLSCVNSKINSDKKLLPLILIGFICVVVIVLIIKKKYVNRK